MALVTQSVAAQVTAADLRTRMLQRIADTPGATVGVVFREVQGGMAVFINADTVFHAASTMKLPVLIEYFRALDERRLRRDQDLLLVNEFASIVDGSPYSLDAGSDSDSSVYQLIGTRVPLRHLAERMILRSSNLATNALIDVVGASRADSTARLLGARTMRVRRGVEDGKAYERGLNNVTSARDLAVLLEAIETGRAASKASCRDMLDILLREEYVTEIPAGLPPGTKVAHKTGWITATRHDAAIVYPPRQRPYVLVVLTRGIPDNAEQQRLIADLSRMVWEAATGPRPAGSIPGLVR